MTKILVLPGLYNSGPKHWQSIWEKLYPDIQRVSQRDWETPVCADWVGELEKTVAEVGEDVVLVAHSLACALVGKWAEKYPRKIKGALLVAPSDTEAKTYPPGTVGFTPMPDKKLPFPSILVASTDDPYVTLNRAKEFALKWGSEICIIGAKGHINSDSGLNEWHHGLELLSKISEDGRFKKKLSINSMTLFNQVEQSSEVNKSKMEKGSQVELRSKL